MTNPQNKITQTYAQDDVQQILQLALVHRSEGGELTKAQLLEIAQDMGISPEELAVAEQEWLTQRGEFHEKQIFNQVRREKLKQSIIKFSIVNSLYRNRNNNFTRIITLFHNIRKIINF